MEQNMSEPEGSDFAVELLRHVVVGMVRKEGIALSTQQFGVFLACYLCPEAGTMRGLLQELEMTRLVVMRALEKLAELDLIRREPDPRDSRNQHLHQTKSGKAMLEELQHLTSQIEAPAEA